METQFIIANSAAERIAILAKEKNIQPVFRIRIDGGGCSGFQYHMELNNEINNEDLIFEKNNVKVIIDDVSFQFLKNSELEFKKELIGSYFNIKNPNAASSCGCGTSFSI